MLRGEFKFDIFWFIKESILRLFFIGDFKFWGFFWNVFLVFVVVSIGDFVEVVMEMVRDDVNLIYEFKELKSKLVKFFLREEFGFDRK